MAGVGMVRPAPGCCLAAWSVGRQGRARRGTAQAGGGAIGPVPEPVYSFLVFALRRCTGRTWVPMTKQEEYVENAVESA